jgi:quercetin dioxygenase-like cupin family protein
MLPLNDSEFNCFAIVIVEEYEKLSYNNYWASNCPHLLKGFVKEARYMGESGVYELEELSWTPLRPDVATKIFGASLISAEKANCNVTLTKVKPGGEFVPHKDSYGHILYFTHGVGEGWLGDKKFAIKPGSLVKITAGEMHSYRNTSEEEMILITINIFDEK